MKSKRIYPAFTISKKGEMSLKNGHPWVYCDELRNEPEGLKTVSFAMFSLKKALILELVFSALTAR